MLLLVMDGDIVLNEVRLTMLACPSFFKYPLASGPRVSILTAAFCLYAGEW